MVKTDITVVLDKSGSMGSYKTDTIGGFNQFLEEQKNAEGEATLTLVQFDHKYEVMYEGTPIKDVRSLNESTYVPRGNTALNDALGRRIVETGERLSWMKEEDRPNQVLFVIITDGYENASQEYTKAQVAAKIKEQREAYNWDFIYLAANLDAQAEAKSYEIPTSGAMEFSPKNFRGAIRGMSADVHSYRSKGVSGQSAGSLLSDENRAKNEVKGD